VTLSRLSAGLAMAAALAVAVAVVPATAPAEETGPEASASPEALLVRATRATRGRDMKQALDDLDRALTLRPGWLPARRELAIAVLRSGDFERALELFGALAGESVANGIASGALSAADVPASVDAEALFGIAIARHYLGETREAERLYRTYADLVGPTSDDAARAYYRLAELFRSTDAVWGSAGAEEAKALAIDPRIASVALFPAYPELEEIPELAPYLKVISASPAHEAGPDAYDSLPVLLSWSPTASDPSAAGGDSSWVASPFPVEILVDPEGRPAEIGPATPSDPLPGFDAATDVVLTWRFEPAVAAGRDTSAWILFEIDVLHPAPTDAAAPDTTEPATGTGRAGDGGRAR